MVKNFKILIGGQPFWQLCLCGHVDHTSWKPALDVRHSPVGPISRHLLPDQFTDCRRCHHNKNICGTFISPRTLWLNSIMKTIRQGLPHLTSQYFKDRLLLTALVFLETAVFRIRSWWFHALGISSWYIFPLNCVIFPNPEGTRILNDPKVGDRWYKLPFTFARVFEIWAVLSLLWFHCVLCWIMSGWSTANEWMSLLFLHNCPVTVGLISHQVKAVPYWLQQVGLLRHLVQFPWHKYWDVLSLSPLLLLLPFFSPTLSSLLHPCVPNALLIFYHMLVIAIGIDAMKKKKYRYNHSEKHLV